MSDALSNYQAARERDDAEADKMLGELHESDPAAFMECLSWEVDQRLPPGITAEDAPDLIALLRKLQEAEDVT